MDKPRTKLKIGKKQVQCKYKTKPYKLIENTQTNKQN